MISARGAMPCAVEVVISAGLMDQDQMTTGPGEL